MANKAFQEKALHAIYARILLYSFLTQSRVTSLADIISSLSYSELNRRIIANLELSLELLKEIEIKANKVTLNVLNGKIDINNSLLKEDSFSNEEKLSIIEKKFEGTAEGLMLQSTNGLSHEKELIINELNREN